jgi:hypothetical protein
VSHVLAPIVAKVFPRWEFHILVDYNFTWITAESNFQRPLSNLSLKTMLDVCRTHLTVRILHHRTSGFSVTRVTRKSIHLRASWYSSSESANRWQQMHLIALPI